MAYFAMYKLALKWALKKPATRMYPFVPRQPFANSRGQLVFVKDNCVYCNICAKKCPTKALTVHRASKKWGIERLQCISCGYCVDACPKDCLALNTDHGTPSVTKDKETY
jgi:ech hydrogenase subunit F